MCSDRSSGPSLLGRSKQRNGNIRAACTTISSSFVFGDKSAGKSLGAASLRASAPIAGAEGPGGASGRASGALASASQEPTSFKQLCNLLSSSKACGSADLPRLGGAVPSGPAHGKAGRSRLPKAPGGSSVLEDLEGSLLARIGENADRNTGVAHHLVSAVNTK